MTDSASSLPAPAEIGLGEFTALIAALMASSALPTDAMLPALPMIGHSLGIAIDSQAQWIITSYTLGGGAAQIVYGPLADRFGRKPILLIGLAAHVAFTLFAAFSSTFSMLIAARILQGIGSASANVLTVSIIRDRYSGSQMARVMSLALIVFLGVPILGPSIGQIIVLFGPWRWIFIGLALYTIVVMAWTAARLPETQHPEDRRAIVPTQILEAIKVTMSTRVAVGYMLAMTCMFGALFAYVNSAQQIFADTFSSPQLFTTMFALVAGFIALYFFVNSRIVGRLGTRRLSHLALVGIILTSALHMLVALSGYETLWVFTLFQAGAMFCFGLTVPNLGSISMEPLGHVAGTAASVQGLLTSIGGGLLGFLVGQLFDGTALPLIIGFTLCGIAAMIIILVTEKGRLFRS
jgi:DHA1 family bicyclomycin/chloramphenicol resistance-like MFS transporter